MTSRTQIDFIINRRYADYRHGTGVQLKLFAGQTDRTPLHICWDDSHSVADTYQPVCNLNNSFHRAWPFYRGRGLIGRLETSLKSSWHDSVEIQKRLKNFMTGADKPHAYVIIASEDEAKIAGQILDILKADYVVNVMDYLHPEESGLKELPHFASVLTRAKKVFALTPPIQSALVKISGRKDVSLLGVAREPAPKVVRKKISAIEPLQIVMMGSVDYTRGLTELHKFCAGLDEAGIKFCLNYIGTGEMRKKLGTQLPVNYRGVLLGTERDAALNAMHLAYLPGPDGDPAQDYLARYSFPSRLTDYFWHGLPVVGPLFENSATAQSLAELNGRSVWFCQDAKKLVAVADNFSRRPETWAAASEDAYDFAQNNFSMQKTAARILAAFDDSMERVNAN